MYTETTKMYQKLIDKQIGLVIRDIVSVCLSVLLITFSLLSLLSAANIFSIILLCISSLYSIIAIFRLIFHIRKNKEYGILFNEAHKKECEELKKCPYLIDSDGTHHFQP